MREAAFHELVPQLLKKLLAYVDGRVYVLSVVPASAIHNEFTSQRIHQSISRLAVVPVARASLPA